MKNKCLDFYIVNDDGPLALICPGGGYMMLSDKEGRPVALKLNRYGINAVVLHYSIEEISFKKRMQQFDEALKEIIKRYPSLHLHMFGIGFSAGAHLLASYASYNHYPFRALVLSYGVLDLSCYHDTPMSAGIFEIMHQKLKYDYSPVDHIVDLPSFLWHTASDGLVPCEHSLRYAMELSKHHIPYELHIFPCGEHGQGLAEGEDMSVWFDLMLTFIKRYV